MLFHVTLNSSLPHLLYRYLETYDGPTRLLSYLVDYFPSRMCEDIQATWESFKQMLVSNLSISLSASLS